jgi:hypothetical protein
MRRPDTLPLRRPAHRRRLANLAAGLLLAACALAPGVPRAGLLTDDAPFIEGEVPPPPAFDTRRLIDVTPSGGASSLRIGVDPATISVGKDDRVVRYVVVAANPSGAMNVMYEGILCAKGEYRLYARHRESDGWRMLDDSGWQPLSRLPQRYPQDIARGGICRESSPNGTPANIARGLQRGQSVPLVSP